MNKKFKTVITILIIGIVIYMLYLYESNHSSDYVDVSSQDVLNSKIEDLKFQNQILEDKINNLNIKLEDLQKKYDYDEELIDLLQKQLESYGIEPYEL